MTCGPLGECINVSSSPLSFYACKNVHIWVSFWGPKSFLRATILNVCTTQIEEILKRGARINVTLTYSLTQENELPPFELSRKYHQIYRHSFHYCPFGDLISPIIRFLIVFQCETQWAFVLYLAHSAMVAIYTSPKWFLCHSFFNV